MEKPAVEQKSVESQKEKEESRRQTSDDISQIEREPEIVNSNETVTEEGSQNTATQLEKVFDEKQEANILAEDSKEKELRRIEKLEPETQNFISAEAEDSFEM